MAGTLEKPRDVVGGLAIVATGIGFLAFGRELEMGTSFRMGPGYFPTMLSWLMIALGVVLVGLALRKPHEEEALGHWPWLGLILVVGAVLFFGLTLRGLGLFPTALVVVLATAWASQYASLKTSASLALGLAAFCSFLFIKALGLPLPLIGLWVSPSYWSPGTTPTAPVPAPATSPAAQ